MSYHKIRTLVASITCKLGLHRWSSNVLREPTFRTAYRVRACSACPARRVDAVPAGGAS
jgi:hypothetical protein